MSSSEPLELGLGPGDELPLLLRELAGQAVQDDGVLHPDGRDGGAQFVGHHAHKIVFHLVQLFKAGDVVEHRHRAQHLLIRAVEGGAQGPEVQAAGYQLLADGLVFFVRRHQGLDGLAQGLVRG